jgi:hypothetical protein
VGKKVELYLLEQVSKGLTVSLAFKCLAGLQPFFTPATVLKQPVKSSICLFRSEGEKYQVILGMQNLGNRPHYSIYVVPRSKKRPQILRKRLFFFSYLSFIYLYFISAHWQRFAAFAPCLR